MTIGEMHTGVNLGVQRMASNIDSNLLAAEVDYYLNESIDDYIKQQYLLLRQDSRNKQSDFVLDNLRTLLDTATVDSNFSVSSYIPNAFTFSIPNDYLFFVDAKTAVSGVDRNNILLSYSAIKKLTATKFNKPLYREYPILIEGSSAHIVLPLEDWNTVFTSPSTFANLSVKLLYVKKPAVVSLATPTSSDLPAQTHKEIVNLTVAKILTILNQGLKQ